MNSRIVKSKLNNLQFDLLFSDIDIDFLDVLVRIAESKLRREFSDMAYGNLITHLALMIKRLQLNKKFTYHCWLLDVLWILVNIEFYTWDFAHL